MSERKFKTDDRVVISNVSRLLNGKFGTIVGKTFEEVITMYIVQLDEPVTGINGFVYKAIAITGTMLVGVQ